MAQVTANAFIQAPLDAVYQLAKDVEAFPSFMPEVKSVKVLERDGSRTVTAWVGVVQGRPVQWMEEDHWDDVHHVATFHQLEGDFTVWAGTWSFTPAAGGTQMSVTVEFELELPLAGAFLSNLLKVLVRKNFESMLAAMKARLEPRSEIRAGPQRP